MNFVELVTALLLPVILLSGLLIESRVLIQHTQHLVAVAQAITWLDTNYTLSSLGAPQALLPPKQSIISVPKTTRFNFGESVTPSSVMIRTPNNETLLTMSIRGGITNKSN